MSLYFTPDGTAFLDIKRAKSREGVLGFISLNSGNRVAIYPYAEDFYARPTFDTVEEAKAYVEVIFRLEETCSPG